MASGMWSGIEPTCSKGVHKHHILLFVLRAGNDIGGDVQSVNCPVDAVGGALGSILGLALLVSIAVNIVALVIILCIYYYGKIERVEQNNSRQ